MPLITELLAVPPAALPTVAVTVDRHTLAKRRWRAEAGDGLDIAVDLAEPCAHGDVLWTSSSTAYVVEQLVEPVAEIPLPMEAEQAANLGWFLGNQHLPVEIDHGMIRLEASPHLVDLLMRKKIPHEATATVFRPAAHSAGHRHQHMHSH